MALPLASGAVVAGGIAYQLRPRDLHAEDPIHPAHYAWPHSGLFSTFDHSRLLLHFLAFSFIFFFFFFFLFSSGQWHLESPFGDTNEWTVALVVVSILPAFVVDLRCTSRFARRATA